MPAVEPEQLPAADLTHSEPTTCSVLEGAVVPMPTFLPAGLPLAKGQSPIWTG